MRKLDKRGITGIETAIVLIAFVIVASVFAFAVLNMGLITTQKAQTTISSGLGQASSAIQLVGSVIAHGDTTNDRVKAIRFYVTLAPGQEEVDFNQSKLVITYTNAYYHNPEIYEGGNASSHNFYTSTTAFDAATDVTCAVVVVQSSEDDPDALLEAGEVFMVYVNLTGLPESGGSTHSYLSSYDWFKIELKPQLGASLSVERNIPATISALMDLS